MKANLSLIALIILTGFFTACNQSPEGQNVEAGEAQEVTAAAGNSFQVDPQASAINWTATKVTGQHNGTLQITSGSLTVNNGNVEGGSFTLDMNTITVLDLQGEDKAKLEGHLRSGDFFEAGQFPTGTFEITSVSPASGNPEITHQITGNLTLKGITKSVTLPANVIVTGEKVSAITPAFTINRTEWGINYNSGIINTAKDKIINDEIGLVINLTAVKG